jgi:hypothetical protein
VLSKPVRPPSPTISKVPGVNVSGATVKSVRFGGNVLTGSRSDRYDVPLDGQLD